MGERKSRLWARYTRKCGYLREGIVRQTNRGKRNRVFEVPDVLAEFNMVERRLASPVRDTGVELPARPLPNKY